MNNDLKKSKDVDNDQQVGTGDLVWMNSSCYRGPANIETGKLRPSLKSVRVEITFECEKLKNRSTKRMEYPSCHHTDYLPIHRMKL